MSSFSKTESTGNQLFIVVVTLVATLGGLLFGYDTAVISGAVKGLESFFITPLSSDSTLAVSVVFQYKLLVSFCGLIVVLLVSSFLLKLFGKLAGFLSSGFLILLTGLGLYFAFWQSDSILTAEMASAIKGFTVSSALIGCIIGGSLGGYISQTLGRRLGLLLAAALFMLSAIGSAIPDTLNIFGGEVISAFIIYRVIGGIGVGLASMLSPMYIAEIAPAHIRGRLVSLNQFAIIFGMLVVYFVNYAIALQGNDAWLATTGWRWMFASETIPAILFFILLFFVPESPRFLVVKEQKDKALSILVKLTGKERAQSVLGEIAESLKQKRVPWLNFGGLVIFIGILLSVFQQFVGINVVLYYAPEIFKTMGSDTNASLLQTIIVGAVNLTFTVLAILTVDRFGRKPLQIIGALGMAVSMIGLGLLFYFETVGLSALFFMLFYIAFFAMSWGPVTWVLLSEIFPNSIKGAMSIAVAAQWLANLAVSWTFPMMNDNAKLTELFHNGFAYWIYGLMGILAAIFMWRVVPETKGHTLEDMEQLWTSKKDK